MWLVCLIYTQTFPAFKGENVIKVQDCLPNSSITDVSYISDLRELTAETQTYSNHYNFLYKPFV